MRGSARWVALVGLAALAGFALRSPASGDGCPDARTRLDALRATLEAATQAETDPRAARALQSARAAVLSPGTGLEPAATALADALRVLEKRAPGRAGVDAAAREALDGLLEDAAWELASLEGALAGLPAAKEQKARARIQKGLDQAGGLAAQSVAKAARALVPAARLLRDLRIAPSPSYGGPLRVVSMSPLPYDLVGLNRPVEIRFSGKVVRSTVRPDTIFVRAGPTFTSQVFGDFEVADTTVIFHPRLPSLPDLSDLGYPMGRLLRVTVVGFPASQTVQAPGGRALSATQTLEFTTAAPGGLLYDYSQYRDPPPPHVRCTDPADVLASAPWLSPAGATEVSASVVPVLRMNRVPLDPAALATRVTLRAVDLRGIPASAPVPGTPSLEQDNEEVRITFRPSVTLADRSRYALRIEPGATDLTGQFEIALHEGRSALSAAAAQEANAGGGPVADLAGLHPEVADPRTFLVFTTRDEPVEDRAFALHFDATDRPADGGDGSDPAATTAAYNDAVPGAVAATVTAAGGDGSLGDLAPSSSAVLDTGSAQAPGGVFQFRRIDIPAGVTVTLTGPLPAVLRSTAGVTVRGAIVAAGAAGETSEPSWSSAALPQRYGGAAGPGGGAGGSSSTGTALGLPGNAGGDAPGGGGGRGGGGYEGASASTTTGFAGGGGGGSHNLGGTAGAGGFYPGAPNAFADLGAGGAGALPRGPAPTSAVTSDGRQFTGVGGGGGGAGGNGHYNPSGWRTSGAGGGGGGGALLISTNRSIAVAGRLDARGGAGGANATGSPDYGGAAGGGGSGGAIALYASGGVDVTGATLDTSGGAGGATAGNGWTGRGGGGGGGHVRLESASGTVAGTSAASLLPDYSTGAFDPASASGDLPSVFTGAWFDLGAMGPEILPFLPQHFTEQEVPGCDIRYEIQMAGASALDPARPDTGALDSVTGDGTDPDRASPWVLLKDTAGGIRDPRTTLNGHGYRFFRLRIAFTLSAGLRRSDGLPFVDEVRIPFRIQG